jgi:hypothetical protein
VSEERDRKLWADICVRLPRIREEATVVQERDRYEDLLADTRAGLDVLTGWNALIRKIDRLLRNVETQVIREGDARAKDSSRLRGPLRVTYQCPLGLCDRRVLASLGSIPHCSLLAAGMEADHSGRGTPME